MEKSIWEERVRKNTSAKGLGSYNRVKTEVCAKKGESVLIVERKERGDIGICGGPTKKRVYLTLQVTPNFASIFCNKKRWKTKDGTRLLLYKSVNHKEWIPSTPYCRYTRWSRKEEGVYETGS